MSKAYDAIIIPGNGVNDDGTPASGTKNRADEALKHFTGNELIIALSAGTVHKPPVLDKEGYPIFESTACARYLVSKGIPVEHILAETSALDTVGNAYFARVIHAEPRQLKRLLLITSDYHGPRTKAIFDWIFSLQPTGCQFIIEYITVPGELEKDPELLTLFHEREKKSLDKLTPKIQSITTLKAFHEWFFKEHAAYAVGKQPERVSGKILKGY